MNLLDLDWGSLNVQPDEDERCGIVLQSGEIIELPNQSSYPYNSFVISNNDLEPYRAEMLATWHTHPRGPNNLSIDDYNAFMDCPEFPHLILTHRSISQYQSDGNYVINLGRRFLNGHG